MTRTRSGATFACMLGGEDSKTQVALAADWRISDSSPTTSPG
jgi:hypothetical protein